MMDICYASNEAYVPYLAVSMFSCILHNLADASLRIHVISNGITETGRQQLLKNAELARKQCKSRNTVQLCFYELTGLSDRLGGDPDTGSYDISMLGRFFIGELLPENVELLLYLDCDTVVAGSLLPLFTQFEHTEQMLYGVPEPTIYRSIVKQLGLNPEREIYINSGVLLVRLDQWRAEQAGNRLLDFYMKNGSRLFCGDQDAINYVLRDGIGYLPPRYNFFTNYRYFRYNTLVRIWPLYEKTAGGAQAFYEAMQHPVVIHYMGAERPWLKGNRNPYRRQYEEMLALSVYAGQVPAAGKELQMLCYHLMNLISLACPQARAYISRSFEKKHVLPRLERLE